MLEQLSYINHLGESIVFGGDGLYVNLNELHDFKWDVISRNDKIMGFERRIHTKSFPARIAALSNEDGIAKRNLLFAIPEKDILAKIPGKLTINGFYLPCYITASKKTFYSIEGRFLHCDITITTDKSFWIREVEPTYIMDDEDEIMINPSSFDSNFRMQFNGQISNPEATISGHTYRINTEIASGFQLIVDSLEEKIYTYDVQNEQMYNAFSYRDRDNYIFEKIHEGRNSISRPESCIITIYEERSEPLWVVPSSEDEQQYANWFYVLENQHVIESTRIYPKNSGLWFSISENGHLIQEKEEVRAADNYGKLENGRLIIYHD